MRFLSLFLIFIFSFSSHAATLLIVGDSLSAGYQMPSEKSWPRLLPESLTAQDINDIDIVNASISGDTTGNGLARLSPLLERHQPDFVLIELGANDGLRGFTFSTIRKNLVEMITQIQQMGAQPLLMQIRVPPNYGQRYSKGFQAIYPKLSEEYGVPLLPFFLEQVILKPDLMMSDGLHPNAKAQPFIADYMAEQLAPHLKI